MWFKQRKNTLFKGWL